MILFYAFVGLIGYLLGALPFGFLVARAKGVDIFTVGSGNPGATNVRRVLGQGPGNLVFAVQFLTGPSAAAWPLIARMPVSVNYDLGEWGLSASGRIVGDDWVNLGLAGLVAAMLGHSYSCFTRFRGGKGVATGAGGICIIMPASALIAAVVWAVAFFTTRYVSLASILAAASLPFSAWLRDRPTILVALAALIALFVIVRHRENLRRLANGTEHRFVKTPSDRNVT